VTYAILAGLLRALQPEVQCTTPTVLHPEMYHRLRILYLRQPRRLWGYIQNGNLYDSNGRYLGYLGR
jgi:hypothetical protein